MSYLEMLLSLKYNSSKTNRQTSIYGDRQRENKPSPVFYCRCKFIVMRAMASVPVAGESWKNICLTLGPQSRAGNTQEYDLLTGRGLAAAALRTPSQGGRTSGRPVPPSSSPARRLPGSRLPSCPPACSLAPHWSALNGRGASIVRRSTSQSMPFLTTGLWYFENHQGLSESGPLKNLQC